MIVEPQNLVSVYYKALGSKQRVGRLLLKNRQIFFEYDASFIKRGLELSPFNLPLKTGVIPPFDRTFDGLFGVFNDSLPDGWGRLLLDRKLISLGFNPGTLSPLDRLCFVGSHGMGALFYEPENPDSFTRSFSEDLDEIDHEIQHYQEQGDERYVDDLLALGALLLELVPKFY
jgi:serine/threonine-protein kinase HipA